VTGPIEFRRDRLLRTRVFLLRHATKLLRAGLTVIVIGFTVAWYGAHIRAANRVALALTGLLWLAVLFSAYGWAAQSDDARALAERDVRDER
jgi:hypothetical protein